VNEGSAKIHLEVEDVIYLQSLAGGTSISIE
jgi:hypothetical protein